MSPTRSRPAARTGRPLRVEHLEDRVVPASYAPVGYETLVNTTTELPQEYPALAADAEGDFVVVWRSGANQLGIFEHGIYAQRYTADGTALGDEFRVNTHIGRIKNFPDVAMDAAGNFVVVWQSSEQDGSAYGVFAQRYDAAGTPQGGEFQVNTTTAGNQESPSVAMDAAGNFVVAWSLEGIATDEFGIFAQRYDAAGVPVGGEFQVNTFPNSHQAGATAAMDPAGNFVIAWGSLNQDGDGFGVYAQRYDAAGVAQGGEFRVNTTTEGGQGGASVAVDALGRFVVAWSGNGQGGDATGIYAQRFDAAGVPQGGEFLVNTDTQDGQGRAAVDMDPAGNFVVVWQSNGADGFTADVRGQRYDAAGVPQGGEFNVNRHGAYAQEAPDVVMTPAGDFVIAWFKVTDPAGDLGDVYYLRYGVNENAPVLTLPTTATIVPGATLGITATATDVEDPLGVDVRFSLISGPAGAAIDPVTGVVRWTPGVDVPPGHYTFEVRVADGGQPPLTDTESMVVTVTPAAILAGDLVVAGTSAADVIGVNEGESFPTLLEVRRNGELLGSFPLADISGRIVIRGFGGNDQITIDSTIFLGADLYGLGGADTLRGGGGPDRLDGGGGNDRLIGGDDNDRYVIGNAWGVDTITEDEPRQGWDTLDLSAVGSDVVFRIGGAVRATSGANSVSGSSLEILIGGAGSDKFRFAPGGKVAGVIDGGGGINALNYSEYRTPVAVNLGLGTATGTSGVANITNVAGGAATDMLVGDLRFNALTGNGGRDILIGGAGADTLNGGSGSDLLLAGSTSHETDPNALAAIRAEWNRKAPYATRVGHLLGTIPDGLNGAVLLDALAVFDDELADALTGGTELDWFLTSLGDPVTDRAAGETVTRY